ncbi:ferrous iron transport protein B [Geopsychrobacter electrodiphilus]|uniref:ferrous iron transport protein B n=1 Tax=Geopsychrobacter electrodiphilus TaxID=225196 RepID=UPI00036BDA96|nr:ferrous iron transport protein B [Geopsychrobacter electrodiphilus]
MHEDVKSPQIVLVGNPNVGKSVLFNVLTGSYTTVSNYPGTSVEISTGRCRIGERSYEVLDTPGMYSMMPITEEERVARNILLTGRPAILLHVVDARNIERMLPMTLQLIEAGLPVILVVNILDEAERLGMKFNLPQLQQNLGVPVVGTVMKKRQGLDELQGAIAAYQERPASFEPYAVDLEADIERLSTLLTGDYCLGRRATAILMMQKDHEVEEVVRAEEGDGFPLIAPVLHDIQFARRVDLNLQISLERKRMTRKMLDGALEQALSVDPPFSERLSRWAMNPFSGIPLLLLVLYFGLYQFVGNFGAGTLVDFMEGTLFGKYINPPAIKFLNNLTDIYWLRELLAGEYGLWTLGVRYAFALVLPIVGTFFLVFSVLEDTGYFPRLAMLVDRLFKQIGLSGRAVIPMVLGFGCDTMATMVTRTLETKRERVIAMVLLSLAIPCSAQLGVILGLLSAVPGSLAIWLLVMVFIFLLIGFLSARVLPGENPVFYMEIPPMRMPQLRNVLVKTLTRMQSYFLEILPLFLIASVILWAGKMSGVLDLVVKAMTPVVTALGLPPDASAAFIFGFFRRDFGAAGLYDLQKAGLLSPVQLTVAAVTLTLFVPCIAQFLMMKKERGIKTASAIFVFVSVLAFATGWVLNHALLFTGVLT